MKQLYVPFVNPTSPQKKPYIGIGLYCIHCCTSYLTVNQKNWLTQCNPCNYVAAIIATIRAPQGTQRQFLPPSNTSEAYPWVHGRYQIFNIQGNYCTYMVILLDLELSSNTFSKTSFIYVTYTLRTIHGGILQCCKLIKQPVGLVLLLLHFVLDNLQLVPNSLQQESCEEENLTTQLPPMPYVYHIFPYLGFPAGTFWECEWWHFARCWAHSQQQLSVQPHFQTQLC